MSHPPQHNLPHAAAPASPPANRPSRPSTVTRTDLYTPEQAAHDRVLAERIRAGKRPGARREESDDARVAMGELIERYQDRVFAICLRMIGPSHPGRELAADLAHDALLRILQGIDSYDGRSRLSTWIFRVTMNVCLSHLRSTKIRRHVSLDAAQGLGLAGSLVRDLTVRSPSGQEASGAREPEPDQSVQQQEQRRRVAVALSLLEPDHRAVLVLRDVQGLDYDQIAAALEVAVGTVKSRLFRARLALRDALDGRPG